MTEHRFLHLIRQDCPLSRGTHVMAYCRDSGGEDQERSTQQQTSAIREYCDFHGLILEHVYVDDARQASNTDKRTQLQELLLAMRNRFKQINDRYKRAQKMEVAPFGIVFWTSNRLGRDSIETRFIKADLRLRGITIVDLSTRGTTGDSGADAVLEAFQEWKDETFLDDLSQNTSRGLIEIVSMRDNDPAFRHHNPDWPTNDGRYLSIFPGVPPKGFIA